MTGATTHATEAGGSPENVWYLFNALGGVLIEELGYAMVYRIYALIIAAVAIPMVYFLVREKPADLKLLPLGERAGADGKYEIISGHRRFFAAQKLGMRKVP